jgi:ADP-ribose pyrophosphatase
MDKKEITIRSEQIYKGRVISLKKDTVLCPNGEQSLREIITHRGGVAILIKVDDKFIIEKQFRYALGKEIYELPAGKLEADEEPIEAAKRECLEETGYKPLEMIHLGDMSPTCGYSTEIIHFYYCPKSIKAERHLDSDEVIDLMYLSLEEIEQMIKENQIIDSKILAVLTLYKSKML